MSDDLAGLEWAEKLAWREIHDRRSHPVGQGCPWRSCGPCKVLAQAAVAALAEPLRQSQKVGRQAMPDYKDEAWVADRVRDVMEVVGLGYGANGMDYEIEVTAITPLIAELRVADYRRSLQNRIASQDESLSRYEAVAKRIAELEAALRELHEAKKIHAPKSCNCFCRICELLGLAVEE